MRTESARAFRRPGVWRQLWQVPVFFTGAVALLAVAILRPLWSQGNARHIERDLAAARHALDSPADLGRARSHAEHVLRDAPPNSPYAGEAHFLLGTVALREAETASANESRSLWQQAREHLEQADTLGTPEADRPKLAYRIGKTYHALNVDPQRVVNCLSWSVADGSDNLFEGYGLLAEAFLRLPIPNLTGALEATKKQLALPSVDEAALAPARVLCGELYCQLDQRDEARKVLARVGPSAAPDLAFRSRLLRARLNQDEGLWAEAATLWEEVRADSRWLNSDPGRILYNLGLCYKKTDQPGPALKVWEECRLRGGDEAQAAALEVALLRLRGEHPATALEAYTSALRGVAAPADYHNSIIDLSEARNRFEAGCQIYRQLGAYEPAQLLARLYHRIALPGVAKELEGQACEAWSRSLREQVPRAVTAQQGRALEEEAVQRSHEAGLAYEAAAEMSPSPADQADWLWHAAADYLEGLDRERAIHVLESFVKMLSAPTDRVGQERLGQAWFLLGEAHRQSHADTMAQAAYQKCIEYPGPAAYRARYELALATIEQKQYDDAEAELGDNLRLAPPGCEAHEKSLVTLAMLLFQRRNYNAAFLQYQKALELYPANPAAPRLRLNYAQCCRKLADKVNDSIDPTPGGIFTREEQEHREKERQKLLERAAGQYQKLGSDLEGISTHRALTPDEEAILRQAQFAYADTRFEMGKYDEALRLYNQLADRYKHQLEELNALRHVWQCHGLLRQPDQVRTSLDRLRGALNEMPAAAFDGSTETATRLYWENWVRDAAKTH